MFKSIFPTGMSHYPTWTRSGDGITVTGKHYLLLSDLAEGMKEVRLAMDELFSPSVPFIATGQAAVKQATQQSNPHIENKQKLSNDLPVNVQLVTLEATSDGELLVRIGHAFAVDEHTMLSAPVELDLFTLLQDYHPISAVETTLSANQPLTEQLSSKIQWDMSDQAVAAHRKAVKTAATLGANKLRNQNTFPVTLGPMQIKTFVVQLQ